MYIVEAKTNRLGEIAGLAANLWPDSTYDELLAEFETILSDRSSAVFLAIMDEIPVGFVHCQLRSDYVEGASSSPVAYIEGIYVAEGHRNKGVAWGLLNRCEDWARSKGVIEMASDCEITNKDSVAFHRKVGFSEANRVVCFIKSIENH